MNNWTRFLWCLVAGGLIIYFAFTIWIGFLGITYPYRLDYGEGDVLWFTTELARGHSMYSLPGSPWYASNNYAPFSMVLAASLFPIFGVGYMAGRLLCFASALFVAGLIYRIVITQTRDWRISAISALLFIGSPYVYHWAPLYRADLIGLAFAFGGVYLVWLWEAQCKQKADGGRQKSFTAYGLLLTASLFFLLALYSKQSLYAAPAAAFLALFARNKRTALIFALVLGAIGGGIYLAIDRATSGGFTFGLITSNATVFFADQLIGFLKDFVTTFPVILALALWGWVSRLRARHIGVLEWYAVIALASGMMAGRMGAWENYFFEAIAIACVFAGFQISNFKLQIFSSATRQESAIRNLQFAIPLLLILQLALFWHDPRIAADLVARGLPANQQLYALLARTPGLVISEDMGALTLTGKEVVYYTFQYSLLARGGMWDQSWELNGLRDGKFSLVILEYGTREDVDYFRRFTREFVSALDRYYVRTQTIGDYEIYTPAPPLQIQRFDFGDDIALVGYAVEPETLKPGTWQLNLVWQAKRAMTNRYTSFVHLENSAGAKIAQDDHEPRAGDYPTTRWAANEMVRETYALNVPPDLSPGKYVLRVGWYDTYSGDRLSVPNSVDNSAMLATFEVK